MAARLRLAEIIAVRPVHDDGESQARGHGHQRRVEVRLAPVTPAGGVHDELRVTELISLVDDLAGAHFRAECLRQGQFYGGGIGGGPPGGERPPPPPPPPPPSR